MTFVFVRDPCVERLENLQEKKIITYEKIARKSERFRVLRSESECSREEERIGLQFFNYYRHSCDDNTSTKHIQSNFTIESQSFKSKNQEFFLLNKGNNPLNG